MHPLPRLLPLLLAWIAVACGAEAEVAAPAAAPVAPAPQVVLRFAAFTTVREAYEKRIVPLFVEGWRRRRGQELSVEQSYGASGTIAREVVEGSEADVVALSNAEDVERLVEAGLVRPDWAWGEGRGIVSTSAVVLAVRPGNPRGLRDWPDLARPGIRIAMPDPSSSGGGRWGITAVYGSALRAQKSKEGAAGRAERVLAAVLRNVVHWAPDARASFQAFERGAGDVAITTESEVMRARMFGHEIDWIVPRSTLRVESPVVIVDANVDRHGVREVAEAFLEHLVSDEAKRAFVLRGFRGEGFAEDADPAHRAEDLWGIEELGGWRTVGRDVFEPGGVLERARALASGE